MIGSPYSEEHEIFRRAFRAFVDREVKPQQQRWLRDGVVDRAAWRKAGEAGFLCPWLDERWGGAGGDFLHSAIVVDEPARAYETGFGIPVHSDVVAPYIARSGSDEQKARWLPRFASGEVIGAIAMTEPGAGSDLAAIRTTAVRDGDHYVVSGAKTFVSNGRSCDLCLVVTRTDASDPQRGLTLLAVEGDTPGLRRGPPLDKIGLASQDTCELAFEDCRVPVANRIGGEGAAMFQLMRNLPQERLVVAIAAQAAAEQVLSDTIAYVKERRAFGQAIAQFQNTQFKLVDCATEIEAGRAFLDKLLAQHASGKHLVKECSMAKLWHSEMSGRVIDQCLQLFGGYGYMRELPVARAFVDARAQRIFAGTSEVMKLIIARQLGLP